MSDVTVTLVVDKETKNTVRYAEGGDAPRIGMLYIPKHTITEMGSPERITLRVAAAA